MGLQMSKYKLFLLASFSAILTLSSYSLLYANELKDLVDNGSFTGQVRYRYEYVDQDNSFPIDKNSHASTARLNLGFKTGSYKGLEGFIEGQYVGNIGKKKYNDTTNQKTAYPVVADAQNVALNQLWLQSGLIDNLSLRTGRQKINIDNQRFIGTVDWRQNDQTFDSVVLDYKPLDSLLLRYGYIWEVQRVFGQDSPQGELTSQSHFIHMQYDYSKSLKLNGYGYLFDFNELSSSSTQTFGASISGHQIYDKQRNISFPYLIEYAIQKDFKDNVNSFTHNYLHINSGIKNEKHAFIIGVEHLEGDGVTSFQTPLATLHKFNGWADKFLSTPVNGLYDYYVSFAHSHDFQVLPPLKETRFDITYHDFKNDSNKELGSEWDISISQDINISEYYPSLVKLEKMNVLLKYANYQSNIHQTDTQKFWLMINVPF